MDETEDRWATPVRHLRPRPAPSQQRASGYSVPAKIYSTKKELQQEDTPEFFGNDLANDDGEDSSQCHFAPDAEREEFLAEKSGDILSSGTKCENMGQLEKKEGLRRGGLRKSFSAWGESPNHSGVIARRWTISSGHTAGRHSAGGSESFTDSHSLIRRPSEPGKRQAGAGVTMQVAGETLPGGRERMLTEGVLKRHGRAPGSGFDGGTVHAHRTSLSLTSSFYTQSSSSSANRTPRNTTTNYTGARMHPPAQRRVTRQSLAGDSLNPMSSLGIANQRTNSKCKDRRNSISVLPSICYSSTTSSNDTMSSHGLSKQGPVSRSKSLAAPGRGLSRSLPEDTAKDDDSISVHSDLLPFTRKKLMSDNFSNEYRLAMDDLKTRGVKQAPKDDTRMLSKRWSSLQSTFLARKAGKLGRARGENRLSTTGRTTEIFREGQHACTGETDCELRQESFPRSRGWQIVKANLRTIADMAPKDSIDSKPLIFRNIAQLVKAKEFRLMMKRRASFIENGRFQFDEAKQDLYRRYGVGAGTATAHPPVSVPQRHSSRTQTDHGTSRVVNKRNYVGLAGSA